MQATIRQIPRGAFVLVTAHCIFTIAEICEGTEQHLTVEEFLSPNPLVVILEQTVAQRQPPLTRLSKQCLDDIDPLRIERVSANGLACPAVPVGGIARIAFLAMQVGMHPRSLDTLVLLSGFVRSRPITLAIPPQSG
jgi:hypothetical protein